MTDDGLYVTDAELIRRLGVPEDVARPVLRELDSKPSGFPRRQKLWGDRRYWPAVKQYLDRINGIVKDDAARVAPEPPDRNGPPRRILRTTFAEGAHDKSAAARR